ncbi:MAG: succinate dehydrogenase cytochrome b subunit, partial [Bdellovibrionales bacterium]|nr:succinate dehydrogenase cytochrome b subunit [Bdellovibrionales bacterium]
MNKKSSYFCSTIGRKQFVGITGLLLSFFVLTHMLGNLLIFLGPEAYNVYSHKLVTNPFIYVAEAGLLGAFIVHVFIAIMLTRENKKARPQAYAMSASGDKATDFVQKSMIYQGVVLLVFVVWHLKTFKYGNIYEYTSQVNGEVMRDLYRLIIEVFSSPAYVLGYSVCLVVLGMHLSHGFSSSIRTLGFNHPKYDNKVRVLGKLYAAL